MLSVIIPVFNRPKPLLIGLESVLGQRGVEDEIEIIVVDDHSDTALRLEGWPVRLIRLQKNGGPAAARNAGLSAATGETIAFLDSDDAWLPYKLNHQLICLREVSASNPGGLHAVTCGFYYESGAPRRLYGRMPTPASSLKQFATGCWFSPGSTLLIPRAAFSHVGLFNERQRSLEDFEWFLRFAQKGGRLAVAPHFDVLVRRNQERRTADQVAEAAKVIVGAFDKHAFTDQTWQRTAKAYLTFELSLARLREGRDRRSFSPSTLVAMVSSYFRLRKNYAFTATIPEHVRSRYRQMLRAYPPRVLFVVYSLGLGGTERHLSLILPVLKQRGYGVTLFNISGVHDRSLHRQLAQAGIDVRGITQNHSSRTSVLRLLTSVLGLIKCFALERPQIVHFFLPRAYLIGAPLAVMLRISRRVMSRRSLNNYQAKHKILAKIERRLHRQMTAISGNSQAVIDQLCQQEQVPSEKTYLIYNGISLNPYRENDRAQGRAAMGLASDCLVLIIVANLVPYKGHADLLDALAEIRTALPDNWTLLIVGGDSGAGARLKAKTKKLGLFDHVRFVGLQRNIPELLSLSDIAVLVSHEEGFSNAVLEAMAAGLPVIATSVGGNPEAVVEGTGLLVPPKNPSALAQAILRLANDPAAQKQMGANGQARVETHFSLEACVKGYEALYSSIQHRSEAP